MPFSCLVGETLYLPKNPTATPHLWIVVTPPIETPQQVVIVNITSIRDGSDLTVTFNKGDHSFIVKPSSVFFFDARSTLVEPLLKAAAIYNSYDPFTEDQMKRIQQGIFDSPFTQPKVKALCAKALGR